MLENCFIFTKKLVLLVDMSDDEELADEEEEMDLDDTDDLKSVIASSQIRSLIISYNLI